MIRDIVTDPNPLLHKKSATVKPADFSTPEFKKLIADMTETMYVKDGVGLAAVQVNEPLQICVIAKQYCTVDKNEDLILVNPTWTKASIFKAADEEGCLSVPDVYGQVKRYTKIKVKALDKHGKPLNFTAEDFFARIIQHEIDHINGILFIEKAKNLRTIPKE